MRPIDLKIALMKKGIRQKQIADELRVSYPAVCLVLAGKSKSKRIMDYVAERVGLRKAA